MEQFEAIWSVGVLLFIVGLFLTILVGGLWLAVLYPLPVLAIVVVLWALGLLR